ncbi:hypothetical protein AVEN_212442-1 [Araneus ventricosus]|uniref:Uncharacterized protein n=1 Tax=Araneus ventricosus TaxID=182803 RepID=A0A4Y2PZC0_ARAVE|nr:hypothetical protein AVEN_178187-1 [Araneus ventricosus]GBN56235.1 hypothetical protein AVEN_212442-1 [Araneus ventricosus]
MSKEVALANVCTKCERHDISIRRTESLCVERDRGRKPISAEDVSEVATTSVEESLKNDDCVSSARAVSQQLDVSYGTVWKILRNIVHCFP